MRLPILICLLTVATSCRTARPSAKDSQSGAARVDEEPVWYWVAGDGPQMSLQVYLDEKVIYKTTFPICHKKRSSASSRASQKALSHAFTAPRAIVWQGYKDDDETTPENQRILGDIWLAGSEPDCLILGVSFGGRDSNFMNTVHIVHPNRRDESVVASGLRIVTSPTNSTYRDSASATISE